MTNKQKQALEKAAQILDVDFEVLEAIENYSLIIEFIKKGLGAAALAFLIEFDGRQKPLDLLWFLGDFENIVKQIQKDRLRCADNYLLSDVDLIIDRIQSGYFSPWTTAPNPQDKPATDSEIFEYCRNFHEILRAYAEKTSHDK